jgi:6-phosphogluconate dehydrogenase
MKVGFIGLGQMGAGMAANLIKAGHELTIYNRTRSKGKALLEKEPMRRSTASMRAAALRKFLIASVIESLGEALAVVARVESTSTARAQGRSPRACRGRGAACAASARKSAA